jgi:AraC-like DNA-binding protein
MIFKTLQLKSPLDKFIESIFYFKHFTPEHSIERVVPTGHIFIIFELDGIQRNTFNNKTLKPNGTFSKVWISGVHKNHLSISAHQDSEMFVIQFKPFGGYPFFQFPINQLNDKVIPAQEIFGKEILDLRKFILNSLTSTKKFSQAENWLISKLDINKFPDEALMLIINQFTNQPLSNHSTIVNSYPKTQKHLISQFKKFCGHTPKIFHRIVRFNDILQQINNEQHISWSQIAYLSGYADQSHFIKEFKEFSGFNPQGFIKQKFNKGETNFFPLKKEG